MTAVPVRALWLVRWAPGAIRERCGLPASDGAQAWVDAMLAILGDRTDVRVTVATPGTWRCDPFEERGVTYVTIPQDPPGTGIRALARRWRHPLESETEVALACDIVREYQPDVVHVHGTENAFGLVAPLVTPIPTVISLQGIVSALERLYFAGRSPAEVARMVANVEFLKGRGLIHGYLTARHIADREVRILQNGQHFVGRTEWDRNVLASVNPRAEYFHCDEVMRQPFYEGEWEDPCHEGWTVYSTSSGMPWKGTETLLEAVGILLRGSMQRLRLRIAGVLPESELGTLYRRAARRWGVERHVQWLGRLDASSVASELKQADLFVYPSHADNSPNSVVEAMLIGTPIVASSAGGIPTLIRDGVEGALYPRGDAVSLAAAMKRLLEDRVKAAHIGAAARSTSLRRNDPSAVADRTVEIYRTILRSSHSPGVAATAT